MEKAGIYLMLLIMVDLIFVFGGVIETGATSYFMNVLMHPETLNKTAIVIGIIVGFTLVAAAGTITVGYFAKSYRYLLAGAATILIIIGWDFLIIFNKLKEINLFLAIFFIAPILIMYILSLLEWVAR